MLQFRNSIKRIFGIHTKSKTSQNEKGYNNTLMSPQNKLSGLNTTTRFNSSETNLSSQKSSKDKKSVFNDETSEITNNEYHRTFTRDPELCTIPENRTSDAERSGDTVYDEDSSNNSNPKKLDMFGESCKVINERSPVVTFMDSECLLFTKIPEHNIEEASASNVFGNEAYEDHTSDKTNKDTYKTEHEHQSSEKQKIIRQSYSLDFPRLSNDNKKRKLSIETKLERSLIQPKGFFKETINKLFDQDSKQGHDYFKSYLCETKDEISHDKL